VRARIAALEIDIRIDQNMPGVRLRRRGLPN
jgi:hypothetical protein